MESEETRRRTAEQIEAAYRAGKIDAKLDYLTEHARTVNGSIEKSAQAQESMGKSIAVLAGYMKIAGYVGGVSITALASAIVYLIVH